MWSSASGPVLPCWEGALPGRRDGVAPPSRLQAHRHWCSCVTAGTLGELSKVTDAEVLTTVRYVANIYFHYHPMCLSMCANAHMCVHAHMCPAYTCVYMCVYACVVCFHSRNCWLERDLQKPSAHLASRHAGFTLFLGIAKTLRTDRSF